MDNVQKGWRSREQKAELILQWEQSGKSRKEFCLEQGLNYNSFVAWYKEQKDRKAASGFTEVKIKNESLPFAQLTFPGGIKIDFYQVVPADYFHSLMK